MKRSLFVMACMAWVCGCSSSDDDGDDDAVLDAGGTRVPEGGSGAGGDAGKPDAAMPGSTEIVGRFTVKLTAPTAATPVTTAKVGSTSVSGKVYDAPQPSGTVWDKVAEAGDCVLLTPRAPFCDPPCSGGVCVEEDQCQANPKAHSVGVLHVIGIETSAGVTEFDIEPVNNSYMNGAADTLPFPGFAEGDELSFTTSGGDYAPIAATLRGIAPLELNDDEAPTLSSDAPLSIAWTAPQTDAPSRILVKLDISHHGGSKGKIECDAPDSGSLDIDAELVAKLIDLGVAGFPTVIVVRKAATTAPIAPGMVEFTVSMSQERAVKIPGVSSCTDDVDCDDGKTCQTDLTCK